MKNLSTYALCLLSVQLTNGAIVNLNFTSTSGIGNFSIDVAGQGTGLGETVTLSSAVAPTITNNDPLGIPSGAFAIQSDYTDIGPTGAQAATHFGWSGTTTLSGMDSFGNSYDMTIDLSIIEGDIFAFTAMVEDQALAGNDVVGNVWLAMWPGDNNSGHRASGATLTFVAGVDTPQSFGHSRDIQNANTAAALSGDQVGFLIASRQGFGTNPLVFTDLEFDATLDRDAPVVFTPIPEPSSAALFGLCGFAFLFRRTRRS